MRKTPFFLSQSLICFTLLPKLLLSLPKEPSVEAGSATVHHKNSETMVITTSDKAILDYKSFDIDKGERVKFIQPSSSSTVLNRVKGDKGSKILGNLESNGKVFLVNPNGIYFGKDAVVNVGSLIASTLDITNENFMKDQFSFFLKDKNNLSEIRNEGYLSAEGAIVLMAPIIRNLGVIQANAGKVILTAGEHITLDFHGDGLLEFSVEGELKEALIEHLGTIKAAIGEVAIKLPFAKKVIHEVVNHEGAERGEVFVMEDGVISLVSASSVLAKKVEIEAVNVDIAGMIDVSSAREKGGEVLVFGENIELKGAKIDASGGLGGGTVLIGGEYQGKGSSPHANTVHVDSNSIILANAIEKGDGGLVVLWSKDHTIFNGEIFSQGGVNGGNGGIVESSSYGKLTVESSRVNTLASLGSIGQWLLDPSIIRITAAGGGSIPSNCITTTNIAAALIEGQSSTVTLCSSIIMQEVALTMSHPGVGISFTAPTNSGGILILEGSITTKGGPVTASDFETTILNSITIDTTNSGGSPSGANITFGSMNTDGNDQAVSFLGGTGGIVTIGSLGLLDRFGDVTIHADKAVIQSILTASFPLLISCPVTLQSDAVLNTSLAGIGGDITLESIDASYAGRERLTLDAGELGGITVGDIGSSVPLSGLTIVSSSGAFLKDITTQNGSINITTGVRLTEDLTTWQILQNSDGASISVGTINGTTAHGQSLSLITEKRGNVALVKVGDIIPLNELSIRSDREVALGKVDASSMLIRGLSAVVFSGDVTLAGSAGLAVDSFSTVLNGHTDVRNLSLISFGSILSASSLQILSVRAGLILMNSRIGDIGTLSQPVTINTAGSITIGASLLANLQGVPDHQVNSLKYVSGNTPCVVMFNGSTIRNCQVPTVTRTLQLSHSPFFRVLSSGPLKLGIGYSAVLYKNHSINSYFGKNIFDRRGGLHALSCFEPTGL